MSFDREYKHRKDWRKSYPGTTSKNRDRTCRPHGSCSYCRRNRLHSRATQELSSLERLQEFGREDPPDAEQAPKPRKLKKRWGVEFYAVWFGCWKVHGWYSTEAERDQPLVQLQQSKATDRNGRPLRYRKAKR